MHAQRHVRVYYCTDEVRSLMVELPMEGLLQQGSKILDPSDFEHLRDRLALGRSARIDGPDCWFEYEIVGAAAA